MIARKLAVLFGCYVAVVGCYALFSYILTDVNLVLTRFEPYWQFQWWLWMRFLPDKDLTTLLYVTIISILSLLYVLIYSWLRAYEQTSLASVVVKPVPSKIWGVPLSQALWLMIIPALLAYNALSHDVFNYIFNAKMVLHYGANPHVKTALDFASDEWVRFMHNIHTPAPYGYGWTALSLVPALLGFGKFTLTLIWFKLFALVSLFLTLRALDQLSQQWRERPLLLSERAFLLLNPLIVIEVLGNAHNDLWMMWLALQSFVFLGNTNWKWGSRVAISAGLLVLSISIKLSTVLLVPVWAWLLLFSLSPGKFRPVIKQLVRRLVPAVCVVLLFVPLLTDRSQQFHPWYLTWVLVWIPLMPQGWVYVFGTTASLASLARYVPWLQSGGYSDLILRQQKLITWLPIVVVSILGCLHTGRKLRAQLKLMFKSIQALNSA